MSLWVRNNVRIKKSFDTQLSSLTPPEPALAPLEGCNIHPCLGAVLSPSWAPLKNQMTLQPQAVDRTSPISASRREQMAR